jgi:hypothetical protein
MFVIAEWLGGRRQYVTIHRGNEAAIFMLDTAVQIEQSLANKSIANRGIWFHVIANVNLCIY